jgi:hypothetical protein
MPAEVAQIRAADGKESRVLVERKLGVDGEVAALIIAEESLAALAGPLDRPADPARRPDEEGIFGIEKVARAKVPAHVVADAAHLLRRDPENLGEIGPQLGDAAAASRVERVMTARGVIIGSCAARLHRHAGDALYPGIEPHNMRRARERGGGGRLVANLDLDAQVTRRIIP